MTSIPNTGSQTLLFPEEVRQGLERWQEAQGTELTLERWLSGGRTAARVAIGVVTGTDIAPRRLVVKFCPPEDGEKREPLNHRRALSEAPKEFREAHLVTQPLDPLYLESGWWVVFQDIAGGSIRRMKPVASLVNSETLPGVLASVLGALIGEWNPEPRIERLAPRQYVRKILASRLLDGDRLYRFSEESRVGLTHEAIAFGSAMRSLPNPLRWLGSSADESRMFALMGRSHGDLNLNNVLLLLGQPGSIQSRFRLIDLLTYSSDAPLTRDPCHILLAVVAEHLHELTETQRGGLFESVLGAWKAPGEALLPLQPDSLRLSGLNSVARAVADTGRQWAARSGFEDEWLDQSLLALVGTACFYATLGAFTPEDRRWFFELACRALEEHLRSADQPYLKASRATAAFKIEDDARGPSALQAAEVLDTACSRFDGTVVPVALLSPSVPPDLGAKLAGSPWRLIVDFNSSTDTAGAYHHASEIDASSRLVSVGQDPQFGRGTTTWLAANGLDGISPRPLREWRKINLGTVRRAFEALAISSSSPIVVAVLGEVDPYIRATVEAALDEADQRISLIHVDASAVGELGDYDAVSLHASVADVVSTLPPRNLGSVRNQDLSIPGLSGPVPVPRSRMSWLEEVGDVLHSEAGTTAAGPGQPGEAFYRGREASWLELDVGVDLERPIAGEVLARVLADLENRETTRISLHHHPGAGGTTVGRRVAWDAHWRFPVLVASQAHDHLAMGSRVRELNELSGLAVLVVLDLTGENVVERMYTSLRAASVPCVFLIVGRRTTTVEPSPTDRAFYLGPIKRPNDRVDFARRFARQVPKREEALLEFASRPGTLGVPFFFGLLAFEESFAGLDAYVARTYGALNEHQRSDVTTIALVHRFGALSTPEALLSRAHARPPVQEATSAESSVSDDLVSDEARALLIQDHPGAWRTSHWLVAAEWLRQALSPGADAAQDEWKTALSTRSVRLIEHIADVFGQTLPLEARDILDRLFIERDSQDVLGTERTSFSELLSETPSLHGRLEVLKTLAQTFPDEAHFWAHYGRLLSYELKDHGAALEAVDRALALSDWDDVLHHMRGMVFRNKAFALINAPAKDAALEPEILELVEQACSDFARASELQDTSEYGYVATAQVCIRTIEYGKRLHGDATFAVFLAKPTASRYRALLDRAETALDHSREIRAGDQLSRQGAGAAADLLGLYDDYSGLLQGWRNLLDRERTLKAPIRRRLVRAYFHRSGQWRKARRADIEQSALLLEENLLDDPRDVLSLREWMQVARFTNASLDRAAELVSYAQRVSSDRDVFFYDYVIAALQVLSGRESAVQDFKRKVERSQDRATNFGNSRFNYEWLGHGDGLGMLVNHVDLRDWERSADGPDPTLLGRLEGRVAEIRRPQAGYIELAGGIRAFFTPGVSDLVRGRDENARVSAIIGFRYEGIQAWSVRRTGE